MRYTSRRSTTHFSPRHAPFKKLLVVFCALQCSSLICLKRETEKRLARNVRATGIDHYYPSLDIHPIVYQVCEEKKATMTQSKETINNLATIEAAKSVYLKKSESEDDGRTSMKIKTLIKKVAKKVIEDEAKQSCDITLSLIQKAIVESDQFSWSCDKKKKVTLTKSAGTASTPEASSAPKKRKQVSDEDDEEGGDKEKSNAKKEKKKKKSKSGDGSVDVSNDIEQWRKDNKIILLETDNSDITSKGEVYRPLQTFDACNAGELIPTALIDHCTVKHKYQTPSPIQAQCWPVLLNSNGKKGRDIVGIAETGSGKTLAFAMPALSIFSHSGKKSKSRCPRMLVLAPTRELAMQSHEVLNDFGAAVNLQSLVVYGGVPKPKQVSALRKGVDCVVATPGRLKDLINEGTCDLSEVSYLVLDEADRMLDMGFEEDVKYIIAQCPSKDERQTAMFSATWPAAIRKLAEDFMVKPIRVYVGFESIVGSNGGEHAVVDDSVSANKRVKQIVEVIDDRARELRLKQLLEKYTAKAASGSTLAHDRILIFALYKKEAERLEHTVQRWGYKAASINGNKTQDARTKALAEFKDGSCPLLIGTDVAARGLDIPNVEVVLNYTFPLTIEDYVHRIGRTGRAGKTGLAYTFFQPGDKSHAGELQQVMKQAGQPVPEELMKFGSTIKKKEHNLYGSFGPRGGGQMKQATKIKF
jgi:ATP-dependent RNA helicase DBP3